MDAKLFWTVEAMLVYGGGFVKALARAMRLADDDNLLRLLAAFPEYLAEYEGMGEALRKRGQAS